MMKQLGGGRRRVDDGTPIKQTWCVLGRTIQIPEFLTRAARHIVHVPTNVSNRLRELRGCRVQAMWLPYVVDRLDTVEFLEAAGRSEEATRAAKDLARGWVEAATQWLRDVIIRHRVKGGVQGFLAAHGALAEREVAISHQAWRQLSRVHPEWEHTAKVVVVRYPFHGPGNVSEMQLVVNTTKPPKTKTSTISKKLMGFLSGVDLTPEWLMGAERGARTGCPILVNPEFLKKELLGDSDGDLAKIIPVEAGEPKFEELGCPLSAAPKVNWDTTFATLESKASNVSRTEHDLETLYEREYEVTNSLGSTCFDVWTQAQILMLQGHSLVEALASFVERAEAAFEAVLDARKGTQMDPEIKKWIEGLHGWRSNYLRNRNGELPFMELICREQPQTAKLLLQHKTLRELLQAAFGKEYVEQ